MKQTTGRVALFFGLLALAYAVYLPGLSGGFLFDDFPNLEKLGTFGGVTNLDSLYSYLQSGLAGPTGRPISLLSFLIDDHSWPSDPAGFKHTNLLIHLLIGTLLFWTLYRLLPQIGYRNGQVLSIGLLATALWLLHPYMVSTTLYVVQRMTQLAALFAIAGVLGYLHGRSLLALRPSAGLWWMSLSVLLGTLFATLSKENGALVPVLILMLEWSLARHWIGPGPVLWWRMLFLWLPTLGILGYLGLRLLGDGQLPTRPFTLDERLLTQPRILWEYLYHLFVPRMQTRGLYQDGYPFSTGLLSPGSTLAALLGLGALVLAAILARRRFPLLALAIAFFLAGHLIESTTIGLELYFEHRNYLPAMFLFLPIAVGLIALRGQLRPSVWLALILLPVLVLGALTHQRASLWGDTPMLMQIWATNSPESPRAQSAIVRHLFNQGETAAARAHLEQATERFPHSAMLSVQLLVHRIAAGLATEEDFHRTIERAHAQPFDAQAIRALTLLVDVVLTLPATQHLEIFDGTRRVLDAFMANPAYSRLALTRRYIPYLHMRLYLAQGEIDAAMEPALATMRRYADTDTALSIVANVANAGYPKEALVLMEEAQRIFAEQPVRGLQRRAAVYRFEIERLNNELKMAADGQQLLPDTRYRFEKTPATLDDFGHGPEPLP